MRRLGCCIPLRQPPIPIPIPNPKTRPQTLSVVFHFAENPFFTNDKLTKSFIADEAGEHMAILHHAGGWGAARWGGAGVTGWQGEVAVARMAWG